MPEEAFVTDRAFNTRRESNVFWIMGGRAMLVNYLSDAGTAFGDQAIRPE